jgi:3-deoxy-7-phosphoheptulonate synthase
MTGVAAVPPLVPAGECELLRHRIADAAAGKAVLLHAGSPVAEDGGVGERAIGDLLRTFTQLQVILSYATGLPVVKVGSAARAIPHQAAALSLVRALTAGAGPDLGQISWAGLEVGARHRKQLAEIARGLDFLKGYGLTRLTRGGEVFAGHDCAGCPDCATAGHLLWLDAHPADPDRLTALARTPNALAVRLGPDVEADRVLRLIDRLDPDRDPGRLTLVAGAGWHLLPSLAEKVRAAGADVCWVGDPGSVAPVSGPRGAALDLVLDLADALRAEPAATLTAACGAAAG